MLFLRDSRLALGAETNSRLRVARIGAGGRGTWFVDTIPRMEEVVAICDIDDRKIAECFTPWAELAGKLAVSEHAWERNAAPAFRRLTEDNVKTFYDFGKMFDAMGAGLDAAVVSIPDHTHAVASAAAIRAGTHVFCENPLTCTLRESRALGDLARTHKGRPKALRSVEAVRWKPARARTRRLPRKPSLRRTASTMSTMWFFWAWMLVAMSLPSAGMAVVPEHSVRDGEVHLQGVGPGNPLLYDNDWWFDVFDNNYLWAQASLGRVNLRGTIVTRDMWDWEKGYLYSMQRSVDDARKALQLARASGLRNIPDPTLGSDRVLTRPASGRIEDTATHPSDGSRLIAAEARRASPDTPLLIIAGGPLTTVANALLAAPDIAPNLVVFNLTVSSYGYNGKDGWSAYIVAKQTRYVDWGGGRFWDKNSVFTAQDFETLPRNPFCEDMRRLIQSNLGQANQLGDGAPLVWLFQPRCWTGVETRRAEFQGKALACAPIPPGEPGDVLVIPKAATDLRACREEFLRVLADPAVYHGGRRAGSSSSMRQELTPLHDAQRPLANPHKGWYHHYPDNHIDKYRIARDA
ncbi:MAG TPA: hypothetical protein DCM87_03405, partial [Planctomycetes bacterium]|nr:hypothetical protein [Planctomycetota bacterium]